MEMHNSKLHSTGRQAGRQALWVKAPKGGFLLFFLRSSFRLGESKAGKGRERHLD